MKKFVLLAFGAMLVFSSCTSPTNPPSESTLVLHVTGSARTITAKLPAVDHYSAMLTSEAGAVIEVKALSQETPIALTKGTWSVLIRAFDQAGEQIGEGLSKATIVAGLNTLVVAVSPLRRVTGSFDIVVMFSEAATGLDFLLTPWPNATPGTLPSNAITLSLPPVSEAVALVADTGLLKSGSYTFDLTTKKAEFKGTLTSGDYLIMMYPTSESGSRLATYGEILKIYDYGAAAQTLNRPSFFVNFDAGRGTLAMDPQPIPFGLSSALTPQKFTPPLGEVFAGWKEGNATTLISDEASYTMKSDHDVTLTAQWVVPELHFELQGGTSSIANLPIPVGTIRTLPDPGNAPPTPFTLFKEWNTLPDGSGTSYLNPTGLSYAMFYDAPPVLTLYAQWIYRHQAVFSVSFALPNHPVLSAGNLSDPSAALLTDNVVKFSSRGESAVVLQLSQGFDSYDWYIDGIRNSSLWGSSRCVLAGNGKLILSALRSTFLVIVSKSGEYYSKEFWVMDVDK